MTAPRLCHVSDHLSEGIDLVEAAYMAAAALSDPAERNAMQTVLHHATMLIKGARADVDAYREGQPS